LLNAAWKKLWAASFAMAALCGFFYGWRQRSENPPFVCWKKEFLESLTEAAKEIGEVSDEEILQTVRAYRKERRAPEITVVAES
jgi:hypothetical protein